MGSRLTGLALVALAFASGGCGGGGTSSGATVAAFVAAPLCDGAQRQLRREDATADGLRVRAICLPPLEGGGRVDLALAGRNARRATEDTTAVAYLESPGRAARFTRPIVESADIAWLETNSGSKGIRSVVAALADRGTTSPRDAVRGFLES